MPGQAQMPLSLTGKDLPGLHEGADRASQRGQQVYLTVTGIRNGAAVVAAAASLVSLDNKVGPVFAFAAAVSFLVALVAELWLWGARPDRAWYDGRALAESSKTIAWRYAAGGLPYGIGDSGADDLLLASLEGLLRDGPKTDIVASHSPPISQAMRDLRGSPLSVRQEVYIRDRIDDQRDWYAMKARLNSRRGRQWRTVLVATEVLGVVVAFSRAQGWITLDIAGLVAACVAAGAAWFAVKQHEALARAYSYAQNELSLSRDRLSRITTEDEWAAEVADAEEAISREHTMWRASRSS